MVLAIKKASGLLMLDTFNGREKTSRTGPQRLSLFTGQVFLRMKMEAMVVRQDSKIRCNVYYLSINFTLQVS